MANVFPQAGVGFPNDGNESPRSVSSIVGGRKLAFMPDYTSDQVKRVEAECGPFNFEENGDDPSNKEEFLDLV